MANTPKQITVKIKPMSESAHALLDGILADVWDEGFDAGTIAPPLLRKTDNPYRKRLETKPEPTRDEIARHLDLSHNFQPPQSFSSMSIDNLLMIHDRDHREGVVRHDREDWAS